MDMHNTLYYQYIYIFPLYFVNISLIESQNGDCRERPVGISMLFVICAVRNAFIENVTHDMVFLNDKNFNKLLLFYVYWSQTRDVNIQRS